MTALFTAVDIAGLATLISAVLLLGVGVNLTFVGYRYAKKVMGRV